LRLPEFLVVNRNWDKESEACVVDYPSCSHQCGLESSPTVYCSIARVGYERCTLDCRIEGESEVFAVPAMQ
jgi:hypothetical protein